MKLVVQNLTDLSSGANVMDPQTNSFRANNFEALARISEFASVQRERGWRPEILDDCGRVGYLEHGGPDGVFWTRR